MALRIITASERMQNHSGIKGFVCGPAKIGKTSLLRTLDPASTLFVDLEAGSLSVQDVEVDSIEIRDWNEARDVACFAGGPNPAMRSDQPYSQAHYEYVCEKYGDPTTMDKYQTLFIDSITVLGRLCFQWAKGQPAAFSDKTGKQDLRGAYGLHGQEMITLLSHIQHIKGKNVWFVGLLDEKTDDFNRTIYVPQIEGSKTGLELPGIVDQVITMMEIKDDEGNGYRAFICTRPNRWGVPAGDRSGRLNMIEKPHLGELMAKISGPLRPASERITFAMPQMNQPHLTDEED
jgi:hypothetical protein